MGAACGSVRKDDIPDDDNNNIKGKKRVMRLRRSIKKGCGNNNCDNIYCDNHHEDKIDGGIPKKFKNTDDIANVKIDKNNDGLIFCKALALDMHDDIKLCQIKNPPDIPDNDNNIGENNNNNNNNNELLNILWQEYNENGTNKGISIICDDAIKAFKKEAGISSKNAKKLVAHMYETDAELGQGHESSMEQLAICYVKGIGVKKDYETAKKWLKKAGKTDEEIEKKMVQIFKDAHNDDLDGDAGKELAHLEREGNFSEAVKLLKHAAPDEHEEIALKWAEEDAAKGNLDAAHHASLAYIKHGNEESNGKALQALHNIADRLNNHDNNNNNIHVSIAESAALRKCIGKHVTKSRRKSLGSQTLELLKLKHKKELETPAQRELRLAQAQIAMLQAQLEKQNNANNIKKDKLTKDLENLRNTENKQNNDDERKDIVLNELEHQKTMEAMDKLRIQHEKDMKEAAELRKKLEKLEQDEHRRDKIQHWRQVKQEAQVKKLEARLKNADHEILEAERRHKFLENELAQRLENMKAMESKEESEHQKIIKQLEAKRASEAEKAEHLRKEMLALKEERDALEKSKGDIAEQLEHANKKTKRLLTQLQQSQSAQQKAHEEVMAAHERIHQAEQEVAKLHEHDEESKELKAALEDLKKEKESLIHLNELHEHEKEKHDHMNEELEHTKHELEALKIERERYLAKENKDRRDNIASHAAKNLKMVANMQKQQKRHDEIQEKLEAEHEAMMKQKAKLIKLEQQTDEEKIAMQNKIEEATKRHEMEVDRLKRLHEEERKQPTKMHEEMKAMEDQIEKLKKEREEERRQAEEKAKLLQIESEAAKKMAEEAKIKAEQARMAMEKAKAAQAQAESEQGDDAEEIRAKAEMATADAEEKLAEADLMAREALEAEELAVIHNDEDDDIDPEIAHDDILVIDEDEDNSNNNNNNNDDDETKINTNDDFENFIPPEEGFDPPELDANNAEISILNLEELKKQAGDDDSINHIAKLMSSKDASTRVVSVQDMIDAAEKGDETAAFWLALHHVAGDMVRCSFNKAVKYLQLAGYPLELAQDFVAERMRKGANKAAPKAAVAEAGFMCRNYEKTLINEVKNGKTHEEFQDEAAKYLEKAAKMGHRRAAYEVAIMIRDNDGFEVDYKKAIEYLWKAKKSKGWTMERVKQKVYQWWHDECHKPRYMRSTAASRTKHKGELKNERPPHCKQLAEMYAAGVGTSPDFEKVKKHVESKFNVWKINEIEKKRKEITEHERANFELAMEQKDKNGAFNLGLCNIDAISKDCDVEEAIKCFNNAELPKLISQQYAYVRLKEIADGEPPNIKAKIQLGHMLVNHKRLAEFFVAHDMDNNTIVNMGLKYYEEAVNAGDQDAALQLANAYVEGDGVTVDFKKGREYFRKAGKSNYYIKRRINKKLDGFRGLYEEMFNTYDDDGNNHLTIDEFREFYIACLQTKGMSYATAEKRAEGKYQGRMLYQTIFDALDEDGNHGIEFDELWRHEHTHTSLFPTTGRHAQIATRFFARWHREQEEKKRIKESMDDEEEDDDDDADIPGDDNDDTPNVLRATAASSNKTSDNFLKTSQKKQPLKRPPSIQKPTGKGKGKKAPRSPQPKKKADMVF